MKIDLEKNDIKLLAIMKAIYVQTQEQKILLNTTTDLKEMTYFTSTYTTLTKGRPKQWKTFTPQTAKGRTDVVNNLKDRGIRTTL